MCLWPPVACLPGGQRSDTDFLRCDYKLRVWVSVGSRSGVCVRLCVRLLDCRHINVNPTNSKNKQRSLELFFPLILQMLGIAVWSGPK